MWYPVDYEWIRGKLKFKNLGKDKIIEATNKAEGIVPLRYLQENEAMSMLGMYPVPDGNNKDQVKYMHKKATAWATSIIARSVQQNKSWKDSNSTVPQTMKYPLYSMTINNK